MAAHSRRKARPPLDKAKLDELALAYVGRFATTKAKLASYLKRKIAERGWDGEGQPPVEAVVARLAELGYVDDSAFALAKARSLGARGYGQRRVRDSLRAAGVGEEDGQGARELAEAEAAESAIRFARRRKLGPFAADKGDSAQREKAIAAMVRAGHSYRLANAIVRLEPGNEHTIESLVEMARQLA